MIDTTTLYLLFYSANLAFIITNLYGWILKTFYKAKPYEDNFAALFPSQKTVAALYLAQLFEIPYLLMIGQPKALFYINSFSILLFSSLMVLMCEGYFFFREKTWKQTVLHFLPMSIPLVYLLLAACEVVPLTLSGYWWMCGIVCVVFVYYVIKLIRIQQMIRRRIKEINEREFSNDDDFPVRFAQRIEWLPLGVCLLMFICFICNDAYVKMIRDILFTVVNVWFLLYTINPHRKGIKGDCQPIATGNAPRYRLSESRSRELEQCILDRIEADQLFLDSHLTIDSLAQVLGSNKNYVSEAISRSSFGSFYAMINDYRMAYAIKRMKEDPSQRVDNISSLSGFSSSSVFSQVFKRSIGMPPSQFLKNILEEKKAE